MRKGVDDLVSMRPTTVVEVFRLSVHRRRRSYSNGGSLYSAVQILLRLRRRHVSHFPAEEHDAGSVYHSHPAVRENESFARTNNNNNNNNNDDKIPLFLVDSF